MRTKTLMAVERERESYTLLNSVAVLVDLKESLHNLIKNIVYKLKKIVLLNMTKVVLNKAIFCCFSF